MPEESISNSVWEILNLSFYNYMVYALEPKLRFW